MHVRLMIMLLTTAVGYATDWRQWRGPYLNGSSNATNLPDSLDPNTLLWKTALPGISAATPVVTAGRIYLPTTARDSKRLAAMCLDAATGKVLWEHTVSEATRRFGQGNTMASCSACADESGAAFLFAEGTLIKFSRNGEPLWRRNIIEDYGPLVLDFGFSSSPLLYDGKLYIPVLRRIKERRSEGPGDLESYLLCVDNASGRTVFKYDRRTDAAEESTNAYTTPISATFAGQHQIVVYGGDYLTGHDPADGHELWRYRYAEPRGRMDRVIPTPIADDAGVYCAYPRGTKTFAVALEAEPKQAWVYDVPGPDVPSAALYKGYLYQIEEKQKTLTCLEAASGRLQWVGQLDKSDMYYASVTAADEKLYMVNRKGVVTVAAADPTAFRILNTSDVGEFPVDSTIVAADSRVFLRTAENLYCWSNSADK